MRVLQLFLTVAMVVLVAVALAFAFVTLDAEMEVGPTLACEMGRAERSDPQMGGAENEVVADFDDANRCVDRANLTYDSNETHNGMYHDSSDNESARVLKLPQYRADASANADIYGLQIRTGRYTGAGA